MKRLSIRNKVSIPIKVDDRTVLADFISFTGFADKSEHFAIGFNGWQSQKQPYVRVHSECITGDLFSSQRCDCGEQLQESLQLLNKKSGILIYLRQEGRGIGLYNKLDAYILQQQGIDTFSANKQLNLEEDARCYQCAAMILHVLGKKQVHLITNNPEKIKQLTQSEIKIINTINTKTYINDHNIHYLSTKVAITQHQLTL